MAKRCKHLNVEIDEEFSGAQLIEIENGRKIFDGDAGGDIVPTGRYNVRCKNCGLRKSYTLSNRPQWLIDYIMQSAPRFEGELLPAPPTQHARPARA
jgi:hypothetical protein